MYKEKNPKKHRREIGEDNRRCRHIKIHQRILENIFLRIIITGMAKIPPKIWNITCVMQVNFFMWQW